MASDSVVPAARPEISIHLYAEHLLHIRTLTLTATLSTHSTALTRAVLSADASSITLTHENASATIVLPTKIEGGGNAALELPQQRAKELQLRLMLEEKAQGFLEGPERILDGGNWVPWGARELEGKCGSVNCGACGEALVRMGAKSSESKSVESGDAERKRNVSEWKDLPNENWAEMMDFWHCHKPPPIEGVKDDSGDQKGYAAGNKLRAAEGVGFVDLESFLFLKMNCEGVETINEQSDTSTPTSLCCKACKNIIGAVDNSAEGWRLWKRSLKLCFEPTTEDSAEADPKEEQYPAQKWISAHFLSLIDNQGVRKFEVRNADAESSAERLFVWIFGPDLTFSSSSYPPLPPPDYNRPTRALKAFWRPIKPQAVTTTAGPSASTETVPFSGETLNASVDEVAFPAQTFRQLRAALEESGRVLPERAREFQGWRVGLLLRFDQRDMEGKVREEVVTRPVDVRAPLLE